MKSRYGDCRDGVWCLIWYARREIIASGLPPRYSTVVRIVHPPSALILIRDPSLLFSGPYLILPGATALVPPPNGIGDLPTHQDVSPPMKPNIPSARRPRRSSPVESLAASSSSTPSPALRCPKFSTCYSATSLHGSVDTQAFIDSICTPASLLWDHRHTSQQRPSFRPPLRTSSSPAVQRTRVIIWDDLETEDNIEEMDKRHPSSFQQLEKLGEGTYATV